MDKTNEKKLNVGLFIDTFYPMVDGVIMVVDNYAKRLSKFCNVTVFTLKPRGYKKCVRTYPYKVVSCRKIFVPFLDYDLPTPKSDRKFMRQLEAADLDIVHIHSPFTIGRVGIKYAKKHNVPVIANLHSQFKMDFYKVTKSKLITKMLLKKIVKTFNECDEFYATNKTFAQVFLEYGVNHLPLVQQNGTDFIPIEDTETAIKTVNEKYNLPVDMPVFLFVGRINKLKNIYFLLDALNLLNNKHFKMIFVGDGQDLHDFKNKVASSSVKDNVIFTGKITDRELLAALYLRAKLFLFPSMYDTNSLVQIEAASQKTPTVFLKGSVTSATVTDNVNGFLSDPTPEAYAKRIEEILADDELYNSVSEGAARDIYVSWDRCVQEIYARYLEHIEKYKNKIAE
ncbi:MAG: glycosyltransferase [Clostridiales bacterium]|nr:glycosyltransferase [Clostridiales bacterium]